MFKVRFFILKLNFLYFLYIYFYGFTIYVYLIILALQLSMALELLNSSPFCLSITSQFVPASHTHHQHSASDTIHPPFSFYFHVVFPSNHTTHAIFIHSLNVSSSVNCTGRHDFPSKI